MVERCDELYKDVDVIIVFLGGENNLCSKKLKLGSQTFPELEVGSRAKKHLGTVGVAVWLPAEGFWL